MTKVTYRRMSLLGLMVGTAWQQAAGAGRSWEITHKLWAQCWEHKLNSQTQIEWGYEFSKPIASDMLPSARVHLPMLQNRARSWGPSVQISKLMVDLSFFLSFFPSFFFYNSYLIHIIYIFFLSNLFLKNFIFWSYSLPSSTPHNALLTSLPS